MDTDIADIANLDHLRLAKYFVTPRQWADFVSGALPASEVAGRRAAGWGPRAHRVSDPFGKGTLQALRKGQPCSLSCSPPTGKMDEDEQNMLADRMAAAFLADDQYRERQASIESLVSLLVCSGGGGYRCAAHAG